MGRDRTAPGRGITEVPCVGDDVAVRIAGGGRVEYDARSDDRRIRRRGEGRDRWRADDDVPICCRGERFVVGDRQGRVERSEGEVRVGYVDAAPSCRVPEIPG